YFNNKAQVTNVIDPDGVRRLFQYDARGRLEYEALDLNRNGAIDWSGTDRITQVQRSVLNDAILGGNVVREQRFVWGANGSNSSNTVWSVAATTAGLSAWSVIWIGSASITNKYQITYPATGTT